MHVCLVNQAGEVLVHRNSAHAARLLLECPVPYTKQDLVVACECMFSWYWLADLCAVERRLTFALEHNLPFVLGHALYMKAIHGGKTKNDRIDSRRRSPCCCGAGCCPRLTCIPTRCAPLRDLYAPHVPDASSGRGAWPTS